ncbi:SAM-dependent methyltransferase [Nonomuraea salmonea]|uniref:SAM-dependent methyltransferase n=1 Tax=Nonomuraea salmonea TaxID=46181 RepID=A0ABV5NPI6_9ACTN
MSDRSTRELFTSPSPARVYNALTGGKDNLAYDRDVVDTMLQTAGGLRAAARAHIEFVARATRVVAEAGIRQWLNLGCGLPPEGFGATYDTVAEFHPDARVVYVDHDPHVTVHGRALLEVSAATGVVEADARHVDEVLGHEEADLLNRNKPVGILATALAHFWPDSCDPAAILRRYIEAFPSGYLIFSHARSDLLDPEELEQLTAAYRPAASIYARPLKVISSFLDGLELLEPGLVEASEWRPDSPIPYDVGRAHFVVAVGRFDSDAGFHPIREVA